MVAAYYYEMMKVKKTTCLYQYSRSRSAISPLDKIGRRSGPQDERK